MTNQDRQYTQSPTATQIEAAIEKIETKEKVIGLLNEYAESVKAMDSLIDEAVRRKLELLPPPPPEVMEQIKDLDAEYHGKIEAAGQHQAKLKKAIKESTITLGESVSSTEYSVQFRKGADKVDVAGLKGYGLEHPEVLKLISQEEPTIAIVKNRTNAGKKTE